MNDGSKEGGRGMGNLGWRRGKEISSSKVPQVNSYLWKESKWEDINEKDVGSCDRSKGRVCTEKKKDIPIVKGRKRRGMRVYWRTIEKRVYQTLEVTSNGICILCKEKEWIETYYTGLSVFKQVDY